MKKVKATPKIKVVSKLNTKPKRKVKKLSKRLKNSASSKMRNKSLALKDENWLLKLYVAGKTERSKLAIQNLKKICEQYLKGIYTLEVIDLLSEPERAKVDQIFAIPTLIKKVPYPVRKIIGDLSNKQKVLSGLNLKPDSEN